jgi:uncharacterized phage protein (TIGR02218 family)
MPRNIPAALVTHINQGGTSLCELIKITPTVGAVLAFTDHIQNLTVDGQLYLSRPGMRVSEVKSGLKMEIDTSQAQGFFQTGVITLADILKGKFRDAIFERRFANYDSASSGGYTYQSGQIGRVDVADNSFTVELRGLIQKLSQPVGRVTSRMCDVQRVGDARCKFNLASIHYIDGTPFTQTLTVSSVFSANVFEVSSGYNVSYSESWFEGGYLTWNSGNNAGYTADIARSLIQSPPTTLEFTLMMQPGADIQIGDTFTATAGCDRFATTCQNKFRNASQPNGNLVNFRGYPDLAGALIYKAADGIIASGG